MTVQEISFHGNEKDIIKDIRKVISSGEDIRELNDAVFSYLIQTNSLILFKKIVKDYKIKISSFNTKVFASAIMNKNIDIINYLAKGRAPFENLTIELVATESNRDLIEHLLSISYIAKQMRNSTRGIIPDILKKLNNKKLGRFAKLMRD